MIENFKNKRVLITGHTGFKGSWLTLWMKFMGAKILGISNSEVSKPSNFEILKLRNKILSKDITNFKPDYIFHLAAEAIVKKAYADPKNAWETNTLGTLNILETLRDYNKNVTVVIITSDKVYKNIEVSRGYKENDILANTDPYSASKACADIATQSYISTFLKRKKNIKIAIARAGNVIGGGDWAIGRLIPDCIRSWSKNKKVSLRSPYSTRPWQHVLDVLHGYILLAINLNKNKKLN
jgi:CDP-glucose 4,6-dehydratase